MKRFLLIISLLCSIYLVKGQEKDKLLFDAGFDLYSRYVWRGLLFSDAPNVQPYMAFNWKGWTLMGWGSYALSKNYAEIDLFLSWSAGCLTLNLNDYYTENEEDLASVDYDNWRRSGTGHLVETSMVLDGTGKKIPLIFTASTLVYGPDFSDRRNQNYSTYFEVKYPFKMQDYDLSIFAGGTVNKGYYAAGAAMVNVGLQSTHNIAINDEFSIPTNILFILNPEHKDVFLVLGISF